MDIGALCDVIILVAAVCVAVSQIWGFLAKGSKKAKQALDDAQKEQIKVVLKELLPDALRAHDLEVRDRYKADRQRYLEEIKKQVADELGCEVSTVVSVKENVDRLVDHAKNELREKILTIFHRNKKNRSLEEHEREALEQYYKDYKMLKGNSFIDRYYNKMQCWETIPDDFDYLEC